MHVWTSCFEYNFSISVSTDAFGSVGMIPGSITRNSKRKLLECVDVQVQTHLKMRYNVRELAC